jgi:hypothetical protein
VKNVCAKLGFIQKNMDPEMLEEVKGRQAKMANIQSAMQSGNIKSGYVVLSILFL